MSDKMRVHTLAKQLNVTSKVVLEKCKAEGLNVENHMSTLSAGLEATIREWFSEGEHSSALETAERVDLDKVRLKRRRKAAAADAPPGPRRCAAAAWEWPSRRPPRPCSRRAAR